MKQKARTMTDKEKAEARFEMDGATVSKEFKDAAKGLQEAIKELKAQGKYKEYNV